jgi:hypothetical protein
MENQIRALEQKIEQLSKHIGILEDIHAIRRLQHIYGYYIDKCLYEETVELFSENCEVRFMGGIFKGKAGARRLYIERFQKNFTNGVNGAVYGFLLDHPQLQDVVDVAPDGRTAKARFRSLMQAGRHELAEGETRQWWEGGIYENEYVKEDGIWKFKVLNYRPLWHADFAKGWAHTPPNLYQMFSETYPENPLGPDELIKPTPVLWPETDVVPFHYPHPVTGEIWGK